MRGVCKKLILAASLLLLVFASGVQAAQPDKNCAARSDTRALMSMEARRGGAPAYRKALYLTYEKDGKPQISIVVEREAREMG